MQVGLTACEAAIFTLIFAAANGTAAPFMYHGQVNCLRHEGSAPMSVTFAL